MGICTVAQRVEVIVDDLSLLEGHKCVHVGRNVKFDKAIVVAYVESEKRTDADGASDIQLPIGGAVEWRHGGRRRENSISHWVVMIVKLDVAIKIGKRINNGAVAIGVVIRSAIGHLVLG